MKKGTLNRTVFILGFIVFSVLLLHNQALAASFSPDESGTLTTNLDAYYKLENASDSWSAYDLLTDGSVNYDSGKVNDAADLGMSNGSNELYLSSSNPASLSYNHDLSIAAWVKISTAGATNNSYAYRVVGMGFGTTGSADYNQAAQFLSGAVDEVGIWDKVLSSQEISDLYNGGSGQTLLTGSTISSLQQYTSNGTTTISEGGTVRGDEVVFAGEPGGSTRTLQFQVDVQSASSTLLSTDQPNVTSTVFVSAGTTATATYIGANGNYHWQARSMDSDGVTSTWELFGPTATSTDFVLDLSSTPQFEVDPSSTLTVDLKSYYKLDTDGTDIWGTNTVANNGGTFISGKVNDAVSFGTSNTSECLDSSTTSPLPSFDTDSSMAAWVKINAEPGSGVAYNLVVDSHANPGGVFVMKYEDDSGTKYFRMERWNGTNDDNLYDAYDPGTSNWTTSTDLIVQTVPLYTQEASSYPSSTLTSGWANQLYDNSTTIECEQPLGNTSTIAAY